MALLAKLQFGDNNINRYSKEYLLADFKLHVSRPSNNFRPDGAARIERMELILVAPGKADHNLYEWYSTAGKMDGRIVISLPDAASDQDASTQVIYFNEGSCVAMSEEYHIDRSVRRLLKLEIVAEEFVVDGVTFHLL